MTFENITITKIVNFISIPISSGDRHNIVKRFASGLVFSPFGISKYYHRNKVYVSDNNHVLYLPENGSYSIECIEGDECPLINFKCNSNISDIISFSIENSQLFLGKFKEFKQAWIFNKEKNFYKEMAFIYDILAVLTLEKLKNEIQMPEILKKAVDFIHSNYNRPELSNDKIANASKISTVYFRKLFKKHYNKSPFQYISDLRIQQAKLLLKEQLFSVQEISYKVGFASLYSFSRAFKKSTGYSPSQYKNIY